MGDFEGKKVVITTLVELTLVFVQETYFPLDVPLSLLETI